MQGIVLHCANPDCKKTLLKDGVFPPGTNFKVKCFWCGHTTEVGADFKRITLKDCNKNEEERPCLIFV